MKWAQINSMCLNKGLLYRSSQ